MRKFMRITILEAHDDYLYVAGNIRDYRSDKEHFYVLDKSGHRTEIVPVRSMPMDTAADGERKPHKGYYYALQLPLHAGETYSFLYVSGGEETILFPRFGKYSRLTDFDGCFFNYNNLLVFLKDESIMIVTDRFLTRKPLEHRFKRSLTESADPELIKLRNKAAELKKAEKPIWLVSDRSDCAEDNGCAFFEYLMRSKEAIHIRESHDIRFIIGSDSPDYQKMQQIGPVVPAASDLHKALYIASEFVISSAADEWIRNPLGADHKYFRDMIDSRFVFLQHGVIKDDLSGWLFKLKKNFSIFITSAQNEWHSVCDGNYGYDESVVKLTGLARYDKLENAPTKTIAILPTWRKYAAPALIPGTSERPYSDSFRDTDYFKFYNRLINDERLLTAMNENGYTGTLYMHPSHMNQWKDFQSNDTISVWKELVPFSQVFRESSLLITDYSSVAIDFAYLGKPVIYTQFDKDKFWENHSYTHGYYDYEKDGFGPVCYDYESSVDAIIKAIATGCAEDILYLDRVNSFFAFRDKNNCKRILEEILKL